MYDLKEVGKRLKEFRINKGYKYQLDFSKKTKINPATLSQYECGNTFMTLKHLLLICAVLECSTDELLFGNNNSVVNILLEKPDLTKTVAESIVTLVDLNILTEEKNCLGKIPVSSSKIDDHANHPIYISKKAMISYELFHKYYTSVKGLEIDDPNRKKIAKALIESTYKQLGIETFLILK